MDNIENDPRYIKLLAIGTDKETAVSIVAMLRAGDFPRGLTVSQAIAVGWL